MKKLAKKMHANPRMSVVHTSIPGRIQRRQRQEIRNILHPFSQSLRANSPSSQNKIQHKSTILAHRNLASMELDRRGYIMRQTLDGGVQEPRDASLPGGVPPITEEEGDAGVGEENGNGETERNQQQPTQDTACTTQYQRAQNFQSLIDLVRAAESRLSANGITSTRDQIHALRGIYYGTLWSLDYSVEHSTTRNEGFQRFTRPSSDPANSIPRDVRPLLSCGLFTALQTSQDITDGSRHVDFGHLIIGLDARNDPGFNRNVQYPVLFSSIDLGGTGPELVTWLGDLGGAAAALSSQRVSHPHTSARSVFTGSDYGGSINLEGDVAGFVVATHGHPRPSAPIAPSFAPGRQRLSDALQDYLSPGTPSREWNSRATTFLHMYGGTFNPTNHSLTNRSTLVTTFSDKIQKFACNYLASRVGDHHITVAHATSAAHHVIPTSLEVATAFVRALEDSHASGGTIQARHFIPPSPAGSMACRAQLAAGSLLGIL